MKILNLIDNTNNGVTIKAKMGTHEFEQLLGNLDNLCTFATKTINENATYIKTGSKHSYAKYLLFPVKLRRKYKANEYDYEQMQCGTIEYKQKLYVIYEVPKQNHLNFQSGEKDNHHSR